MKQPEQSYTAIETADGFLFFTHTAEGQANMRKFLQLVADHYFDPHSTSVPFMFTGQKASSDRGRLSIRAGTCSLNILT